MNEPVWAAGLREAFEAIRFELVDDSASHAGHAGAREGGHYQLLIESDRFTNLPRIARHRLIYDALGPLPAQRIHALNIKALAPGER
ncbi:BolA protein [Inhella inkyongensis]|uniref:BolA protein n=1 Tax=Inhella inkyongensis TaxID=392593 RepID=A0A840S5A6_9BURK|nr:BolA family protein [Inhella inkyongensis]MBB5203690.1 BolA protein [Inhella inkyongensis]